MQDDRRQYRTVLQPLELRAVVTDEKGSHHWAEVLELSGCGMRIALAPDVPVPRLGSALDARLESRHLKQTIRTPATVLQSDTTPNATVLGLQLRDWLGVRAMVPPELLMLFNLRSSRRFELNPAEPIPIRIRGIWLYFDLQGVLRDLSRGGLGFCASPDAEEYLSRTDHVQLSFALPGRERPFEIEGFLRHRSMAGEHVRYGICFDPEAPPPQFRQYAAIERWIEDRRKKALGKLLVPRRRRKR